MVRAQLAEYYGLVTHMDEQIGRIVGRVGDTLEVPDTNRQPEPVDLSGRARTPDQWQPDWIVRKYFRPSAGKR